MRNFIIAISALILFSCSKDDKSFINPSSSEINFEGEGGEESISFNSSNWEIIKVINQNGSQNIFGNIYSFEGDLIQENEVLRLSGLGKLEAVWPDKGFIINRDTETSITISLNENFTKENFGFIIYLKSDNNFKQISINQKPSKGYEIESIKYTIESNDSDSIFVQKTKTRYFNINSSVSPIFFH